MSCHAGKEHPAALKVDKGQHVQPPQRDGLDM
jgi:hypothetical protein